jgi:hypothetical protein
MASVQVARNTAKSWGGAVGDADAWGGSVGDADDAWDRFTPVLIAADPPYPSVNFSGCSPKHHLPPRCGTGQRNLRKLAGWTEVRSSHIADEATRFA